MRMSAKQRVAQMIAALVVVGALLVAQVPGAAAASKPKSGGSITYLRQNESRTLDAAKLPPGLSAGVYAQAVYDQLFYEDKSGNPTPGLALSLETANNNTLYTLHLRKGVTFSDGTPFNAAAVIAHWKRMQDPATASPGITDATEISSMDAVDDSTVRVALVSPDATFRSPLALGNLSYIPSPTAVAKYGASFGTSPETTVGAGPFKVQEFVLGDHVTFTRNSGYWDKPKPYLDSMTFKLVVDPQTRYNTFITGGADLVDNLTAAATNVQLDAGYPNVSPLPFGGGFGFAMNTSRAPTDDVDVRLALAYAVDMKAVLQRAGQGTIPAPTLYDKSAPWYTNLPVPTNNVKKAQSLIDGYLKRTGKTSVSLEIVMAPSASVVMEALQQEWSKVKGLDVKVTIEPPTSTQSRIARRDYPNGLVAIAPFTPRGALNAYVSTSTLNLSFLNDPQMDKAAKAANVTTDPAKVKAAMKTIAERFNADMPYLMFWRGNSTAWTQKNVKGIYGQPNCQVCWKNQDMYKAST